MLLVVLLRLMVVHLVVLVLHLVVGLVVVWFVSLSESLSWEVVAAAAARAWTHVGGGLGFLKVTLGLVRLG